MAKTLSKRQTISVVIMTKNYEHKIEEALKSATWADEIVIWDGYSTDKTLEICRRYTDKIHQSPWSGSFSIERNQATSRAAMDWCLHIDPDERITPKLRDAILRILSEQGSHKAYEFRKKNFFLGHWMRFGGWYHYSLHFFKKGDATYKGKVHENLKVQGTIGKIEAPLEHYPFESVSEMVTRHNRYSSLEAREELSTHGNFTDKKLMYELKKMPLKRFFKFYIKKKAFLDGKHGLFFSILFAWVHFINWAKVWELSHTQASS